MNEGWIKAQAIIAFAALLVLIIYTIATWLLRRTSIKQNELLKIQLNLSLRPLIMLYRSAKGEFLLKNIGHSPALNVNIEPITIGIHRYEFENYYLLEAGESTVTFNIAQFVKGPMRDLVKGGLNVWEVGEDFVLNIVYTNIQRNKYISKIRLVRTGFSIELLDTFPLE